MTKLSPTPIHASQLVDAAGGGWTVAAIVLLVLAFVVMLVAAGINYWNGAESTIAASEAD